MRRIIYILAFLSIVLTGCPTPKPLPEVPRIEYRGFILEPKTNDLGQEVLTGTLTFYFEDGDGDIGRIPNEPDTLVEMDTINNDIFLFGFEQINGEFKEADDLSSPYAIGEQLDREGQNKTLRGEIEVDIEYLFLPEADTIRYTFFLIDRSFHRSNTDTTAEILFTDWRDR